MLRSAAIRRLVLAGAVIILPLLSLNACATNHLLEWSDGEPSMYKQPSGEIERSFVRPAGTIAAFPVALVWDIATFPVQWMFSIYPYGDAATPEATSYTFK